MRRTLCTIAALTLLGACSRKVGDAVATPRIDSLAADLAPAAPASVAPMEGAAKSVMVREDVAVGGARATNLAKDDNSQPSLRTDPTIPSMIVRNGYANLQVDSLELAIQRARDLAARLGGYVANSSITGGEHQARTAALELKIPAARYEDALTGLSPIGKLENLNSTAEDVGEEFVDVTARIENAKRLEGRLITLLATRTGKLQDVLSVEQELSRVREEIERYEGRLRFLRTRTATSTLTMNLHEPGPLVVEPGPSVIGQAVREMWRNFVHVIASGIASLGWLVPVGLLLYGLWRVGRRLWRKAPPAPATA